MNKKIYLGYNRKCGNHFLDNFCKNFCISPKSIYKTFKFLSLFLFLLQFTQRESKIANVFSRLTPLRRECRSWLKIRSRVFARDTWFERGTSIACRSLAVSVLDDWTHSSRDHSTPILPQFPNRHFLTDIS